MFTPTTLARFLSERAANDGGVTVWMDGSIVSAGYIVGGANDASLVLNVGEDCFVTMGQERLIAAYVRQVWEDADGAATFGAWFESATGKLHIDSVTIYTRDDNGGEDQARSLALGVGKLRGEIAIYDAYRGESVTC